MDNANTPPRYRLIHRLRFDQQAEHRKLIAGLRAQPAYIEPKYFYDQLGCALYGAICQLDEYYLTRTERSIFQTWRAEIVAAMGPVDTFVDLGAGDCCKAMGWLPFVEPARYLAVDIAAAAIETALATHVADFPEVEMMGLVTDFSETIDIPADLIEGATTFFYPGSSIGNFAPEAALRMLTQIRSYASNGLLIGVDAKKEPGNLEAAYADALGVTAAFNLNVLRHINRLIGSDFQPSRWRHVGLYNEAMGRVEMHLESLVDQTVLIDGHSRVFAAGERIHTESSYKYTEAEFTDLLLKAGFDKVAVWTDAKESFWVFFAV